MTQAHEKLLANDIENTAIALPLLHWFDHYGRKSLPWQRNRNPYRVWVSEIMLQQTQVTAVIPFFIRFMEKFPSIQSLAESDTDTVMHYWSGLGYYARARNLHKAANRIVADHGGIFPQQIDQVMALPGIGRSTAGAILAFCMNQRHPILDGNVKRVFTRYFAIHGYPGNGNTEKTLWKLADTLTPGERVADYTQAIMDLGATLCTRSKPRCPDCPLGPGCTALAQGKPTSYPYPKPKKHKPLKSVTMLLLHNSTDQVLLVKRPPSGIWGGLWSLPEVPEESTDSHYAAEQLGIRLGAQKELDPVRHSFTHYDLLIRPVLCDVDACVDRVMDAEQYLWYNLKHPQMIGLPAVISKLLTAVAP